jgi:hypothetical protein
MPAVSSLANELGRRLRKGLCGRTEPLPYLKETPPEVTRERTRQGTKPCLATLTFAAVDIAPGTSSGKPMAGLLTKRLDVVVVE